MKTQGITQEIPSSQIPQALSHEDASKDESALHMCEHSLLCYGHTPSNKKPGSRGYVSPELRRAVVLDQDDMEPRPLGGFTPPSKRQPLDRPQKTVYLLNRRRDGDPAASPTLRTQRFGAQAPLSSPAAFRPDLFPSSPDLAQGTAPGGRKVSGPVDERPQVPQSSDERAQGHTGPLAPDADKPER
jgi:hypothetical protein